MDAAFLYWDKVYGSFIEDPESDFKHGYAEGYDHIIQNGKVVYDFPGMTTPISSYLLFGPGSTPPKVMTGESLESRVYQGIVNTPYEQKLAATSSRLYLEGRIVGDMQLPYSQREEFVGPNTPTMALKWPLLKKLEKEAFLKIVYGKASINTFDEFTAQWYEYGGSEISTEVNRWDRESAK
jgi:putative aldouronate transport system substrate-binding protein